MKAYKRKLIEFALNENVLSFGEFTLKSGRISPYFFNIGLFQNGKALAKLGEFYADAIVDMQLKPDVLFGPAYKGIPLISATSIALYNKHNINLPWCFNRKEQKDHGEKGELVGANLKGNILLIDDVMTAGTAIRESMSLIQSTGANPIAILTLLDRQEKGLNQKSAMQEISEDFKVQTSSLISLEDLLSYLKETKDFSDHIDAILSYKERYGI